MAQCRCFINFIRSFLVSVCCIYCLAFKSQLKQLSKPVFILSQYTSFPLTKTLPLMSVPKGLQLAFLQLAWFPTSLPVQQFRP